MNQRDVERRMLPKIQFYKGTRTWCDMRKPQAWWPVRLWRWLSRSRGQVNTSVHLKVGR